MNNKYIKLAEGSVTRMQFIYQELDIAGACISIRATLQQQKQIGTAQRKEFNFTCFLSNQQSIIYPYEPVHD